MTWWHGDYRLDQIGRTVEQIREAIAHKEAVIKIREMYSSSREGYMIRTGEIVRGLEGDRQALADTLEAIKQHKKGRK